MVCVFCGHIKSDQEEIHSAIECLENLLITITQQKILILKQNEQIRCLNNKVHVLEETG